MEKNTKIVISLSIGLFLLLGGWMWQSEFASKETQKANLALISQGSLVSEEQIFDFGSISMAQGKVSHEFKIQNKGGGPVKIEKIYTSCMCTEALFKKDGKTWGPFGMPGHSFIPKINQTLNPGQEAIVKVVFDPRAHGPAGIGKVERAVYLEQNGQRILELRILATVTP